VKPRRATRPRLATPGPGGHEEGNGALDYTSDCGEPFMGMNVSGRTPLVPSLFHLVQSTLLSSN